MSRNPLFERIRNTTTDSFLSYSKMILKKCNLQNNYLLYLGVNLKTYFETLSRQPIKIPISSHK